MPLSQVRATELARRLEIPFDGICLACLSLVTSAIHAGDPRDVSTWVRRMTPDLWSDGLDEIAVEHIVRLCDRDDPEALEAHADLARNGYRTPIARAIVLDLALRLAEHERATRRVFEEVMLRDPGSAPELN
jgi:hypothetical protein